MKKILIITIFALLALPGFSQDSLTTYILSAVKNSPSLQAKWNAYQAQVAGACGAGMLNDPELSVGIFPKAMQHVNVKQQATFSLMQMFPWFGTLKAGRKQMEYQAEAAYQQYREQGIELAFDMQKQWWNMLATQEKIRSVSQQIKILDDIRQMAIYQYKSATMGKNTKMSDQLRLEAETKQLRERQAELRDVLALQRQQFNITMHRDTSSAIVLPDIIVLRQLPVVNWSELLSRSPQLLRLEAQTKAYKAQEEKAKGMGMPMIGIGVEYMLNGKVEHPMMEDMNGNDMLMPMLKVTLPIYRKKINMARKNARYLQQSAQLEQVQAEDNLRSTYLSIGQRAEDTQRKVKLYDEETALLDKTLLLMKDEYVSGNTQITDILQTERQNVDYALKKAEAYAAFNILVAETEKLLSTHDYVKESH